MSENIADVLVNIPLFKGLSEEELQTIDQYMGILEFDPGEVVFKEGDPGDFVCFVLDGKLNVMKKSMGGEQSSVAQMTQGRAIGEMSIVDTLPRSATVIADTKCTLSVLRKADYERMIRDDPHIGIKLISHIARTLSFNLRRATGRLADILETEQPR